VESLIAEAHATAPRLLKRRLVRRAAIRALRPQLTNPDPQHPGQSHQRARRRRPHLRPQPLPKLRHRQIPPLAPRNQRLRRFVLPACRWSASPLPSFSKSPRFFSNACQIALFGAFSLKSTTRPAGLHKHLIFGLFRPASGYFGLSQIPCPSYIAIHHDGALPEVTETGYCSIFAPISTFTDGMPPESFIRAMFPQEAKMSLF
jgi:hypothetical protein